MRAAARAFLISVVVVALIVPTGAVWSGAQEASSSARSHGAAGAARAGSVTPSAGPVVPAASPSAASPCNTSLGWERTSTASKDAQVEASLAKLPAAQGANATAAAAEVAASPAATAVAGAIADGACDRALFPPRAPASEAQIRSSTRLGEVQPLYGTTPAPTGLADYGLSAAPNGSLVPTVLNTTGLLGIVDVNATGIQPLDLYNAEPDSYSIQLNAVLTNVTLFGVDGYSFWTQNVVEFFPSAQTLFLITNVWNFSGDSDFGQAIYAHGSYGQLYDGDVYEASISYPSISYPFDLSLYLNATLTGGRDAVYFAGVLNGPGERINVPFDNVVFNSLRAGGRALRAPAEFTANGYAYNLYGLTDDFELDLGGPGGGSQATLMAADARLGLAYWDASAAGGHGAFVAVPSAFNFGGDTGETSTGGTVTWSDAVGGPGALGAYGTMATGPATLSGLWNATGPEGSYPVTLDASPSAAFEVVTPLISRAWTNLTPTLLVAPGVRSSPAEAYDPALGATILFGGYDPANLSALNDTWEFSNGIWTELHPTVSPAPRFAAGFVYDAADGYLLLFGGRSAAVPGQLFLNDTWSFTSTGWHELSPAVAPASRGRVAMTYDAADAEVVLFGGGTQTVYAPGITFNDTWVFHGGQWYNITSTAGPAPPPTDSGTLVYDAADGYVLLLGGRSTGEIEYYPCAFDLPGEWVFSGGEWSALAPTGAVPPAGIGTAWYDPATELTYYYEGIENLSASGGSCQAFVGDTYAYRAGAWALVVTANARGAPVPRAYTTVAEDPVTGTALMFGGQQGLDGPFFSDTWQFNGTAARQPSTNQYTLAVPSVAPIIATSTLWLAPDNYTVETELSGYSPVISVVDVAGPTSVSVSLTPDPSLGIYTPLWAWSNETLASIAISGGGTPTDPYVLPNASEEHTPLLPVFAAENDYGYAVYPGLFLLNTNASVVVAHAPSFWVSVTITFLFFQFTISESLPLWFWNASGVALVNSTPAFHTRGLSVAQFLVEFYDSPDDLVAGDTFEGSSGGVLLQQGPTGGPYAASGGGTTVWGNEFTSILGLAELESPDLIYDNEFYSQYEACQPGSPSEPDNCWPVYSVSQVTFSNTWNVSVRPASATRYAPGFPLDPLSGSIVGTSWQGGNFWPDYGYFPNPYGVLPFEYVRDGFPWISPGGDYEPLLTYALYTVTFTESGLPVGATWGAVVNLWNLTIDIASVLDNFTTDGGQYSVLLPNATPYTDYRVLAVPPLGFVLASPNPPFVVQGANLTVPWLFVRGYYTVTISEAGLAGTVLSQDGWSVDLNGTLEHSFTAEAVFHLPGGSFPLLVQGPSGWIESGLASSLYVPYANRTVRAEFYPSATSNLVAVARGLPTGEVWCFQLVDEELCSPDHTLVFANLTPGVYPFQLLQPLGGQTVTVSSFPGLPNATSGPLSISGRSFREVLTFSYPYPVTFTEQGLSPGTAWCVSVNGARACSSSSTLSRSMSNGTYPYGVPSVPGYVYAGGTPRRATVTGGPGSVDISFEPKHQAVTLYGPQSDPSRSLTRRPELPRSSRAR